MTAVEVREQFVESSGDYMDRITLKSKNLAEKIDLEHITDYNKEFFVSEMHTFISDLFGI